MDLVAGIAGLASVLTSWIVGGRLILLARRTRQAPELLIGLALFLVGGFWSPLVAIGRQATLLPDPLRAGLVVAGALCAIPGVTCLALFNWRVFRPREAWAGWLAVAFGAAQVAVFVAQSVGVGWVHFAHTERGPWTFASWVGVPIYVWSNLEAWRHYGMMRRREALGLADPIVTDRLRLWSFVMLMSLVASLTLGTCQALGMSVAGSLLGLTLTALSAGFSATCLWLAFVPPPSYLARVRERAAAA